MITNIKIAGNVKMDTPCEISLNAPERTFIAQLLAKACSELLELGVGHRAARQLWNKICADSKTYWPDFPQTNLNEPEMDPGLYGLELALLTTLLIDRGVEND